MNKSLKTAFLFLCFAGICTLSSCDSPTNSNSSENLFISPEEVISTLRQAYQTRNLDRYMNLFVDENCSFVWNGLQVWGIEQERQIHMSMFSQAEEIALDFRILSTNVKSEKLRNILCSYRLNVRLTGEQELQGQGEVDFTLTRDESHGWRISLFSEKQSSTSRLSKLESASANADSADYFPLQVGNDWTYRHQFVQTLPDEQTGVTDSVIIKGNLYYHLVGLIPFPFFVKPAFVRVDTLNQLKMLLLTDSTEQVLYNFSATPGDSLIFQPPGYDHIVIVELLSRKDSLKVPAGEFNNILEFLISDFNSGSRFLYEFAANVGMIRQRGTNQELALKSAFVNGKKYPVITGINTNYFSWTEIKRIFLE